MARFGVLIVCAALALGLAPVDARGQDPTGSVSILVKGHGCDRVRAVETGAEAPCNGYLVPDGFVSDAYNWRHKAEVLLPAAEARAGELVSVESSRCDGLLDAERTACDAKVEAVTTECPACGWFWKVAAGFGAGAAATTLVFLLAR